MKYVLTLYLNGTTYVFVPLFLSPVGLFTSLLRGCPNMYIGECSLRTGIINIDLIINDNSFCCVSIYVGMCYFHVADANM